MRMLTTFLATMFALALPACGDSGSVSSGSAEKAMQVADKAAPAAAAPGVIPPGEKLILETKYGKTVIRLRPDLAPLHVAQVKKLTADGFYNGLKFHRVIPGFMAQTGDPQGTGAGGSTLPDLKAEFTNTPFERGTVGAARTNNPNSANSQFFICFTQASNLNGAYTVWGQVVEGMQFIDAVAKGEPPANPDKIIKMSVE
jgi:peptidylprolyl isomerase